ncbi:unnamed protein product [Cuscuta campestris]|uniref:Retrovirus-related Pol polyprotein from transposon TNT 1-94-like beta-barrel domain-containing protein n=1 Tax=Cuscuta campestris TaxID=132261 RepID=A0A484KWC7_9ASTE|nr:unnamed protein product [Cuscuta campestris]
MGNGGSSKIIGMGDVCLETSTGCRLVLRDVRHVLDIRLSLISAGLLDDEGYANQFCDGRWKLSQGSLIMARVPQNHGGDMHPVDDHQDADNHGDGTVVMIFQSHNHIQSHHHLSLEDPPDIFSAAQLVDLFA